MADQATPNAGAPGEWGTASVDFSIGGQRVHADITIPAGPVRARMMLPVLQKLADFITDRGEEDAKARGESVTCKKGCGACCRQMVPVSEMEAHHLRDLIARLPEPRQSEIRARFARAKERYAQAGLLDKLESLDQLKREELAQLGREYFALHLACPFLEEESCSIHPERPFICREYLVTSPVENCSRPDEEGVRGLPLLGKMSRVVARLGETHPENPTRWMLLALAPEWAAAHTEEPPPRPGPEVLQEVFEGLGQKG